MPVIHADGPLVGRLVLLIHQYPRRRHVPQLYLTEAPGEKRLCLLGFERVQLRPGKSRHVTITTDPRPLAHRGGHLPAGARQDRR